MFEITPWRPFRELERMRREMDRLWSDVFTPAAPSELGWAPSVDVSETKDAILVRAEIPGMDVKDIDISIVGDTLTIKGEKKQKVEEKDENYYRIECSYGSFTRSLRLPTTVDADKVQARYEKGVLNIQLPKKEEAKPKQIEVKTA